MPIDANTLRTFEDSLARTSANPAFLTRFYDIFRASSPKVQEKFAGTDFGRQNAALRASFDLTLEAARGSVSDPERLLAIAERHSSRDRNIGAELYDLWLDSLLAAVRECDPGYDDSVNDAWERVMMVGIRYLLEHY
jgi:hemoglobin-like flavoprotein